MGSAEIEEMEPCCMPRQILLSWQYTVFSQYIDLLIADHADTQLIDWKVHCIYGLLFSCFFYLNVKHIGLREEMFGILFFIISFAIYVQLQIAYNLN